MKVAILFSACLAVTGLFACKSPNEVHSQTSEAATSSDSSLCRWNKAKTYADLKQLALFNYDLPDDAYKPGSYSAPILTGQQVLEDLACMRLILTQVYSGTDLFKQQGEDLVERLDSLVASYRAVGSPNQSPISLGMSLPKLWGNAFDGHTAAGFYSYKDLYVGIRQGFKFSLQYPIFVYTTDKMAMGSDKKTYLKADENPGRDIITCGSLHLTPTFNASSPRVAFTGYVPGNTSAIPNHVDCKTSSDEDIALQLASLKESDAVQHTDEEKKVGATLTTTQDGIDILTIASFPDPATEEQKEIAKKLAASDRPLIIDVRGDGGGSPQFNQLLQEALFSADQIFETSVATSIWSWLKVLSVTQVFKDQINQDQFDPQEAGSIGIQHRTHLENELKTWEYLEATHLPSLGIKSVADVKTERSVETNYGKRSTPRIQPVVILTDRGCGSQCDFFVSDLRHLPTAKGNILGIPTAGRLNFGSEGYIFLPNSHIRLAPSGAWNEHKPAVIEGEGIQPDLFVLDGDVKMQGLAYMRQLLKNQR